jgi:hypothetical protein
VQISLYNADRIGATGLEEFAPEQITLSPRPRTAQPHTTAQDAS